MRRCQTTALSLLQGYEKMKGMANNYCQDRACQGVIHKLSCWITKTWNTACNFFSHLAQVFDAFQFLHLLENNYLTGLCLE